MQWEKTPFWPGKNAQNGLILDAHIFLDVLIPMAQVLRLSIQIFLSYGLYVCIILETAHHRTTFRIFCNFAQKMTPEEISCKCCTFLHQLYFFLMGRSRIFWGGKGSNFIWRGQNKGVRGEMGGEPQNEGFSFLQNSHY